MVEQQEGVPNLIVNTTCARRVQVTNITREYHAVFSHLFWKECEKGDETRGPQTIIRTPETQ